MSKLKRSFVKYWMRESIDAYVSCCDEVNLTQLAEDAAQEFDLYEDDSDATIPEWVFELSSEVAEMRKQYA